VTPYTDEDFRREEAWKAKERRRWQKERERRIDERLRRLGIVPGLRRKRFETAEEEAQRIRWTGWRWMGPTR
jgi:hypothetical protein